MVLLPEEKTASNILHPSMETFDWRGKCMFSCGPYQKYNRHTNRNKCHEVTTSHLKEQVLLSCQKQNDQISKEVALRVRLCNDLGTMEACYHTSSKITFMNPRKHLILEKKNAKKLTGQPVENEKLLHPDWLCEWIEQEAECYTVKELHQRMIEMADSPTVYSTKWLKKS